MFFTSSYALESRLNVTKLTKEDNTNRPTLTDAVTKKNKQENMGYLQMARKSKYTISVIITIMT